MAHENSEKNSQLPQIGLKDEAELSKLQKQFNTKIKKIDKLKAELAEKRRMLDEVRARVQKEIQPLVGELVQKRIAYVKMLDQMYPLSFFRKKEKEKLAYLIEDLTYSLIENYGVEELTELHDKYADLTYDEEAELAEAEAKETAQSMLKNMLGLDVDLEDLNDFDALQAKLDQQMQEEQDKRDAQRAKRQKSKAQLAKEEKIKAELQNISKATRRMYTNLVKLLHPDKEQDATARTWKEEAMKKVTIAYNQDDFFELLRLQMEFMHEQELNLDQVPEDQLKYYVQVLTEQIRDLQDESFNFSYGPDARLLNELGGSPKQMEAKFRRAKNQVRDEIKQISLDIIDFQDPAVLREYLKELRF